VFQQNQISWNPAAPAYGRFWVDSPEGRKRRTITLGVCATRTCAKRKIRDYIEAEGINSEATLISTTTPGTTFRDQAKHWIASLATRRRRPVKPATIFGWQHALDKWILPTIGDRPIAEVSNAALKLLIETMADGGLAAKTIVNYSLVPKLVVASVVTSEGEQVYPRKWNHDFVGLPIIDPSKQHRPTVNGERVSELAGHSSFRFAVLFSLIAGTGLRIGEALAVKASDFTENFRVLKVTRSIWHGKEQTPKTPSAVREIDITEELAAMVRDYAQDRTGYLFATRSGRPLSHRNVNRAAGVGLHALRRFRTETLRRAGVPEGLIALWVGHAPKSITDLYAEGLKNDRAWRRLWCERAGLGFSIGLYGREKRSSLQFQQAA
jgi:integrase